jgi:protein CrcB
MLTYALIGLGGALGSVARAWLGNAMVALTGPGFPWGTILINIVGSFVIGFFGTLTATDGRFAVPFDVRAFVMVGICGGFTTFSSFSLQTLELLRDGRPGHALANIALSVALCLTSVAAGYSLALMTRTSRLAVIGAATSKSITDSTLVALHRPEAVPGMLAVARQLMAREDGRIIALAIDGPVLAELQPTEEVLTRERRTEIAARRMKWVVGMRSTLDRWVEQERGTGHSARWIEVRGDGASAIAEHGPGAHLLLLEQAIGDNTVRARLHAALIRARRPVLLVPSEHAGEFGRIIAVAWRDDPHVRQALRTAAPLLSKAEQVLILRIGSEPDDAPLHPVFDGLPIERITAAAVGDDTGAQLVSMAHAAGADLLVIGSYGLGSRRKIIFDNVTESILRQADTLVFMQHRDV